jgi:hypothetical protein
VVLPVRAVPVEGEHVLESDRPHVEVGLEVHRPLQLEDAPTNLYARRESGERVRWEQQRPSSPHDSKEGRVHEQTRMAARRGQAGWG